jgi:asparagine synthase (glutamine-hydrolysing)
MCGIYGSVSPGGASDQDAGPALEAQRHRGPDASGIWSDGVCVLGHRRLAIIDLSEAGRQPLANEDGTIWITFNGEVYNFQGLRAELEGLGHRFRTRTDTEAIVHAYEQWGTRCVHRLRGMFALAIWDQGRRRLFLVRDRLGKKPLFYTRQGERFQFASELQGLLCDPKVPREVDLDALDCYLSWGYIPAPSTAFRGIFKLPPAHWLTLDLDAPNTAPRLERYWSLAYGPKLRLGAGEACEALREKLTDAVRLRMVSDVPLGAFLSGGIDSSIVVGLMARLSDRPVRTFSIGFEEAAYNELDHAERVAKRWGTEHHPVIVRADALAVLPMLVRHFGEPYADSSAVPSFYVAEATRRSVTVALNGDGGDESFAGYPRYFRGWLAGRVRAMPCGPLAAAALRRALPPALDRGGRIRRYLARAGAPLAKCYGSWLTYFSPDAKRALYDGELARLLGARRPEGWLEALFDEAAGLDSIDAATSVDIRSYLPYDLLVKVDITAMASSLEARSPFLDHELMEFAALLPSGLKLRGRSAKHLLKQAFADLLPRENLARRKIGFGIPVGQWLRGPLSPLLCDTLLSETGLGRGYFRPAAVRRLVNEHLAGQVDHGFQLWSLLVLELWHREVLGASIHSAIRAAS